MHHHRIPYAGTHRFSPLVLDYLAGKDTLEDMRLFAPTREGLHAAAAARTFDATARLTLVTALRQQYAGMELPTAVRHNLEALGRPQALTVTTGHQLCLFGGPLYVPFKILNVVRLARELSAELDRPVLPVFWMATEDHDRAEIDHAWLGGTKVQWKGSAAGAVGRMPLTGIEGALQEAEALLGNGPHTAELRDLLHDCYRPERSLAQATRSLVHALFGRFGVLCVDGDDPALKQCFVPHMREELLNQVGQRSVEFANAELEKNYKVQAHARGINLFHLSPGHRRRIVQEGEGYRVLDGGPSWSAEQLLAELEQHPEDFSPNVLLRPVYQEVALPNIAYLGGGGELAYWLQLRWLFQGLRVPMPVVLLRSSAGFIAPKHLRHWADMGLDVADLFAPADAIKARVAVQAAGIDTGMEQEREALTQFYTALANRAAAADPTLRASVEARAKVAMRGLDRTANQLVRAAKRSQQVHMDRIDAAHAALFPGGGLQERRDNILPMIAARGEGLLDELLERLDPLDPHFSLFEDR